MSPPGNYQHDLLSNDEYHYERQRNYQRNVNTRSPQQQQWDREQAYRDLSHRTSDPMLHHTRQPEIWELLALNIHIDYSDLIDLEATGHIHGSGLVVNGNIGLQNGFPAPPFPAGQTLDHFTNNHSYGDFIPNSNDFGSHYNDNRPTNHHATRGRDTTSAYALQQDNAAQGVNESPPFSTMTTPLTNASDNAGLAPASANITAPITVSKPTLSDISLANAKALVVYRKPLTVVNDDLELVKQNKTSWIKRFLAAFDADYEVASTALPRHKQRAINRRQKKKWEKTQAHLRTQGNSPDYAETCVLILFYTLIDAHKSGLGPRLIGTHGADARLKASDRAPAIERAIQQKCGIRRDVIRGLRLFELVAHPAAAEAKKSTNGEGNFVKGAQLAKVKGQKFTEREFMRGERSSEGEDEAGAEADEDDEEWSGEHG